MTDFAEKVLLLSVSLMKLAVLDKYAVGTFCRANCRRLAMLRIVGATRSNSRITESLLQMTKVLYNEGYS